MMVEHRFEIPDENAEGEPKRRSWWTTCLIGCLIITVIVIALSTVIGIWVAMNMRKLVSNLASEGLRQGIQASDLDPQVKQDLIVQVDRVADAYRDGKLSNDKAKELIEKLVKSPVMASLIVTGVEKQYFARSGLSDEEKAAGKITLQRYIEGLMKKQINEKSLDDVMPHIANRDRNGGWQLKQQVSDEELRAFLATAKAKADEAGVPEKPEPYNPVEVIKTMVDEALQEN